MCKNPATTVYQFDLDLNLGPGLFQSILVAKKDVRMNQDS